MMFQLEWLANWCSGIRFIVSFKSVKKVVSTEGMRSYIGGV